VLAALESDAAPADNPRFKTVGLPNDLPVYALRPNQSGGVEKTATIVASVPRPNKVRSVPDAYAVRVWGSDMAPKYRPGDDLAVDPIAPPRPQCGVLLISKEKHVVEIGDFVAEGADLWMVQKFGETPATMTFSRLDYPIVHVVCGLSRPLKSLFEGRHGNGLRGCKQTSYFLSSARDNSSSSKAATQT
jgi:hypothetical protein